MNRPGVAGLLAVLLVASAVVPVGTAFAGTQAGHPSVSGSGTDSAPAARDGSGSLVTQQEFDQTEFHIHVFENGSARWTFRYTKELNSSNRAEFEDYKEEFNSNETQLYRDFKDRSRDLAAQGENVTGRDMEATGFRKEASIDQVSGQRGVVEMSFVWTNFAATRGDRLLVGDVFQGGLYIGENQALTFSHGSALQFYDAQPDPTSLSDPEGRLNESSSITYRGPNEFNRSRPSVVLGPPRDAGTGTTDTSDPPVGDDGFGPLALVSLFVALLLGLGAVYAYRSGALGGDSTGGGSGTNPDGSGDGGGTAASPPAEPAISDEELLSDEDRVLSLLEERGGRMKQVKIVEETDWSKSKVSMLLSDMEEAGDISKLRVGRENIVSLAGHEPDAARSPFDDEE